MMKRFLIVNHPPKNKVLINSIIKFLSLKENLRIYQLKILNSNNQKTYQNKKVSLNKEEGYVRVLMNLITVLFMKE